VLLFVGIIFTTVAWLEGYKSDDPLREYGRLTRAYKAAKDANAEMKDAIRAAAVAEIKRGKDAAAQAARSAKAYIREYSDEIARSKAAANDYRVWRGGVEELTRTLLSRYRGYYLKVDGGLTRKPKYFDDQYSFPDDVPFLEEEQRIGQAESRLLEYLKISGRLEQIRDYAAENEHTVIGVVEDRVDKMFASVVGVASRKVSEQNSQKVLEKDQRQTPNDSCDEKEGGQADSAKA
jgi:hypothetical protein